jgi:signal peptidase I
MGDDRNDSADSRYHCGPHGADTTDSTTCDPIASDVPDDDVIGIAVEIVSPPARARSLR